MKNPNLGRAGFVIGEQNRNLIFAWYMKNPCALQSDCVKALCLSKSSVNRGTRAIRNGWRPTDPNKAYSKEAWGVATLHLGSFSPIVGPLAGHIDDLVDESVKAAQNDALEVAEQIALTLKNAPMPHTFMDKYPEAAIWGAGADNHAAKIALAIRGLKSEVK